MQIYVPWNQHERTPGRYDFEGDLDVAHFLALASKVGLWVNIRPGPYICAEGDAGGIPWWFISTKVTGPAVSAPSMANSSASIEFPALKTALLNCGACRYLGASI